MSIFHAPGRFEYPEHLRPDYQQLVHERHLTVACELQVTPPDRCVAILPAPAP